MSPLGIPFEREGAPSRRGPGSSVVTLVGLLMALLLLVALCHGGILSSRESAAPHTNAVFIATFFANFGESPKGEVRRILLLGTSVNRGKEKSRSCHTPRPFVQDLCAYPSAARALLRDRYLALLGLWIITATAQ